MSLLDNNVAFRQYFGLVKASWLASGSNRSGHARKRNEHMDIKQAVTTKTGIRRRRNAPALTFVVPLLCLLQITGNSFPATNPPPLPPLPAPLPDYTTFHHPT